MGVVTTNPAAEFAAGQPDGPGPGQVAVSRWIDLGGPLHYLDFGGPPGSPVIVCVHGLGGSALNWAAIGPLLAQRCRVLAPDLAGHGLTQSRGRATDVQTNRALLHRFIESVAACPVIVMGNSMGGMIALLEAAAAPRTVAGLILLDPAAPFVPARPDPVVAALFAMFVTPGMGRVLRARRRRMSPEALVAKILALCCSDVSRVPADIVQRHVELARQRAAFIGTDRDFTIAVRSIVATAGYFQGQPYRRGIRSVTCPVLLLHGERDRLVPVAVARALALANPSWSFTVLPGVGHVPQLEVPRDTADIIGEWLGSAGRRAAETAPPGPAAEPDRFGRHCA